MNYRYIYAEIGDEMKRMLIVCAMLALATVVNAQREPKYKYNYSFKTAVHSCPPSVVKDTVVETPGASTVEIELLDCDKKPIFSSATVSIKGKDGKAIATLANDKGKAVIARPPGPYNVITSAIGYNSFTKDIVVTHNSIHKLIIVLGKPAAEIYDIHSKTPLSAKKIEAIKACVEQNPSNAFKCSVKNAYSISIEI